MSGVSSTALDLQEIMAGFVDIQHFYDMNLTITLARQLTSPSLNDKGSEQECGRLANQIHPQTAPPGSPPRPRYHARFLC